MPREQVFQCIIASPEGRGDPARETAERMADIRKKDKDFLFAASKHIENLRLNHSLYRKHHRSKHKAAYRRGQTPIKQME